MKFFCDGCKIDRDFDKDFGIAVISGKKEFLHYCRACIRPAVSMPDVYWDGKPEEGSADDPVTGKPRIFSSKGEKAAYLRERGIVEAGDRVHGSFPSVTDVQPKQDTKEIVREALQKVKQMGRDYKRQEYLRITKEGNKYA